MAADSKQAGTCGGGEAARKAKGQNKGWGIKDEETLQMRG